jgi:hypothetical protein
MIEEPGSEIVEAALVAQIGADQPFELVPEHRHGASS